MKQGFLRALRWVGWTFAIAVGLMMLLSVLAATSAWWILELPFQIIAGWLFYLDRIEDEITWNWETIASGLIYLVLSVAGFHWIVRGFAASREKVWHWRWTLRISALFLIVFGVSLAIGGLVHQAVWLARADKWITTSPRQGMIEEVNKARNVVQAIKIYASDHGGIYPPSVDALFATPTPYIDSWEKYVYYTLPDDEPPAPWFYVRGLNEDAPGDLPLLIAPRTVSAKRRIIARNDGSVAVENPTTIRNQLLPKWKEGYAALGIPMPQVLAEYEQVPTASAPKK